MTGAAPSLIKGHLSDRKRIFDANPLDYLPDDGKELLVRAMPAEASAFLYAFSPHPTKVGRIRASDRNLEIQCWANTA